MGNSNCKARLLLREVPDTECFERAPHQCLAYGQNDTRRQLQETSDECQGVIAWLGFEHRVIVCRDGIQWIAQRRKKGGAERPWRSLGYFRSREALTRFCATLCVRIDPAAWAALAALPEIIGGST